MKHSSQAPNNLLAGWAVEAFRRTVSRKAEAPSDVTDKWLKSWVPKLKAALHSLAEEESHLDEPVMDDFNLFLQDGKIQLRIVGNTEDGEVWWAQHAFEIAEAVK